MKVVNGLGKLPGRTPKLKAKNGKTVINFDNAIIAAGSRPIQLPFIPHEDRAYGDSTDASGTERSTGRWQAVAGGGIIVWNGYRIPRAGFRLTWLKCSTVLSRRLIKTSLCSSPSASGQEIQPDAGKPVTAVEAKVKKTVSTFRWKAKARLKRSVMMRFW